jgi:hypothetical protein
MLRLTVVATLLALANTSNAQAPAPTPAPAPAPAAAPAPAPVSPAKKELVTRVLQLLQPAIEGVARQLVEQPAMQLQQGAAAALQRVAADRREAMARDLEADLRKYAEETVPFARDRAVRIAPTTIGPLLESRFSEDELRQIVGLLESPVNKKFQQTFPEMQRALAEKLVSETRSEIEPRVRALDQTMSKRLGIAPPPEGGGNAGGAPAPAPARAPARPASGARR